MDKGSIDIIRPSMYHTLMDMAEKLSQRSTCKRANVGALLVTKDLRQIVAMGYNSPTAGTFNDACTNTFRSCGCIHAEANCLVTARPHIETILFSTREPCSGCTDLICNAPDIASIVWPKHKPYFRTEDQSDRELRFQSRKRFEKVGKTILEI